MSLSHAYQDFFRGTHEPEATAAGVEFAEALALVAAFIKVNSKGRT